MAALEILVHFSVLPQDFAVTEIIVPDDIDVLRVSVADLPPGWDGETISDSTREIGDRWARQARHAILSVPSAIVSEERNFIINPAHPAFTSIRFFPSTPFRFDPRLK